MEIIVSHMSTAIQVLNKDCPDTPYTPNLNSYYFWRLAEDFWNIQHWDDAFELDLEHLSELVSQTNNQSLIDAYLDLYPVCGSLFCHLLKEGGINFWFYILINDSNDCVLIFFRKTI